jgi:hypothetical protein
MPKMSSARGSRSRLAHLVDIPRTFGSERRDLRDHGKLTVEIFKGPDPEVAEGHELGIRNAGS